MARGRPSEALASYQRALAVRPDCVPALNNRGVALRNPGCPAEALASFDAGASSARATLVEQILASHRAAASAARRIVDKMTENFRFACLIAFARMIHLRRDPVDTCLSCFCTLFAEALPCTYDLAELGRYHRAYEGLMDHWRTTLPPGMMLEVRYEDAIADLEGQSRRIIDRCGIEWDARCLEFHRSERSVRTASFAARCIGRRSDAGGVTSPSWGRWSRRSCPSCLR